MQLRQRLRVHRLVAVSFVLCTFAALISSACGGSGPPPPSDVDEDSTCAGYSPGHQCVNPDNFELCRALEQECPGQVQVMESCPLQFSCPQAGAEPGADESTSSAELEEDVAP